MKTKCNYCGMEFKKRRSEQSYCSKLCASKRPAWNKGKRGTVVKPKTRVSMICPHCGDSFDRYPYQSKKKTGKYCGQKCYMAARWNASGLCKWCGKKSKTRFCDPKCQKNFWNSRGYMLHKRRRNWERKKKLIEGLGGKCRKCGESDIRVLDVNHIDRTQKKRPKNGHYTWGKRFADWEANKDNIELLCSNCHRRHTWEQMGYGKVD